MSGRGFSRTRGRLVGKFAPHELEIMASLVGQMVELLEDMPGTTAVPASDAESPFDLWEAEFAHDEPEPAPADPVLRRLFPDAYPGDPEASAEFRRFSQDEQRVAKITAARTVIDDLSASGGGTVRLDDAHVTAWLTTLTATRLALAVRLGVDGVRDLDDELRGLPPEDPRPWLYGVYEWFGWVQESLLDAL